VSTKHQFEVTLLKVAVQRSPAVSPETAMPAVALVGMAVIVTVEPS
jgi:hypothetical protein